MLIIWEAGCSVTDGSLVIKKNFEFQPQRGAIISRVRSTRKSRRLLIKPHRSDTNLPEIKY